ncbi:MAG: LysM repeat-containing protein [Verrucomicrobia bacterium]|jgi:LysM repeat protein|nr:MAG: LysM repeat-containing protein [Verrucomicrobiota bacterium]
MKSRSRRPVRSARLAAAIARDDPFGVEVEKGPGFGRVVFVFLLLHAVGIGGFAAYKWINPDPAGSGVSQGVKAADGAAQGKAGTKASNRPDVEELLAPRRGPVTPMVLDYPEKPGFKRYRVGDKETLVEIVRQFHASVAEVEKLNGLKPGEPLVSGQWLTIPDNKAKGPSQDRGREAPIVPRVIGQKEEAKPKSEPVRVPVPQEQVPGPKSESGPSLSSTDEPPPSAPPKALPVRNYLVAKGDTAYSIARRHKVDWQELLRVNGMSDPRQLRAGQVLRIP